MEYIGFFFFSSRRRHTRWTGDWSSDVCSSDLQARPGGPRDLALEALARVDQGAWANLVLPRMLAASGLAAGDRAAVTDLVYGSLRMRGAIDHALRPLSRQPLERLEPSVLSGLRLGAYELLFAGTAPHAALNEVVGAVRREIGRAHV